LVVVVSVVGMSSWVSCSKLPLRLSFGFCLVLGLGFFFFDFFYFEPFCLFPSSPVSLQLKLSIFLLQSSQFLPKWMCFSALSKLALDDERLNLAQSQRPSSIIHRGFGWYLNSLISLEDVAYCYEFPADCQGSDNSSFAVRNNSSF